MEAHGDETPGYVFEGWHGGEVGVCDDVDGGGGGFEGAGAE